MKWGFGCLNNKKYENIYIFRARDEELAWRVVSKFKNLPIETVQKLYKIVNLDG